MSTNSQDQELDLSQIGKGIINFFQNSINKCFDLLFYILDKKIIISILFIIGVGSGFYLDKGKTFTNEITVIPNFGSNEYIYNQVDFIQEKLKRNDTAFFKSIGIKNSKKIGKIEIKPQSGLYNFISDRDRGVQNFEMIKLMAEDGDISKILEDDMTSRNYYLHKITIETSKEFKKEELIEPLLKYFDNNSYFLKQQETHKKNTKEKIILNDSLIKQVDQLLLSLTRGQSGNSVAVSEKSAISSLIEKKDALIKESQYLRLEDNIYDKIIKPESLLLNKEIKDPLYLRMKFLLPIILILIYLIGGGVIIVFKKQKQRYLATK